MSEIDTARALTLATLPDEALPVSLARNPHRIGGCENENWLPNLTDGIGKRCAGRDPMDLPVEVLTASGHPPRRTRDLVAAYAKGVGGDCLRLDGIRWHGDIRH